jgi:hypothetical protein
LLKLPFVYKKNYSVILILILKGGTMYSIQIIRKNAILSFILLFFTFTCSNVVLANTDPLPSWNDTSTKKYIMQFVKSVTNPGSDDL